MRMPRGFVAQLGYWMVLCRPGIDGLLTLDCRPDGGVATLTQTTWHTAPDDPAVWDRLTKAMRTYGPAGGRVEIELDPQAVQAGRQLQAHRDQFTARRRQVRSTPADGEGQVVGLWRARQRRT
jgi:hypothetical protein